MSAINHALALDASRPVFPVRRPRIQILIIYELDLNRVRAELMQEELVHRMGQSFTFSVSWCELKSLEGSQARRAAAASMEKADIICFSILPGGDLPRPVVKCTEKALLDRERCKPSLLVLVEAGGAFLPRLSRAEITLSHLSLAAGVDCLCYSDSIPIARAIRNKSHGRHLTERLDPPARASYGGGRNAQYDSLAPALFSSRHQLATAMARGNPQL